MNRLDRLRKWLLAPKSRFKVGDSVQVIGSEYHPLVVVIEISNDPDKNETLIHCQWTDPAKGPCRKSFSESDLEPFDWYHVHRNLPMGQ